MEGAKAVQQLKFHLLGVQHFEPLQTQDDEKLDVLGHKLFQNRTFHRLDIQMYVGTGYLKIPQNFTVSCVGNFVGNKKTRCMF